MNGSKNMNYRGRTWFIVMLCVFPPLFAEEQTSNETMPSIEFLEFLGEWETEEGEWIDPVELENDEFGKLIETESDNEN